MSQWIYIPIEQAYDWRPSLTRHRGVALETLIDVVFLTWVDLVVGTRQSPNNDAEPL